MTKLNQSNDENEIVINGAVLSEDIDNVKPDTDDTYYPDDKGPNIDLGY